MWWPRLEICSNMCHRAVSGIPSDGNRVDCGAMLVARKSYYDEEYSVYLCGRASLLSLTAVRRFASYYGVRIRPDDGG